MKAKEAKKNTLTSTWRCAFSIFAFWKNKIKNLAQNIMDLWAVDIINFQGHNWFAREERIGVYS